VVEFAFTLPLLIILLFGIMEFSLVLFNKAVITNASRVGSRSGTVFQPDPQKTDTEIQNIVIGVISNNLITFGSDVVGNSDVGVIRTTDATGDEYLTITVDYDYEFLLLPNFLTFGNDISLRAETTMRFE